MDKKLSRQILFKPGSAVVKNKKEQKQDTPPEKPHKSPILKPKEEPADVSGELYKWLKSHPLINLNGLCRNVGTDRANFIKAMTLNREVKPELLAKMTTELKKYGYGCNSYDEIGGL